MKTVALHTLGCKLNFSETSTIGNEFIENGFTIVDQKEKADVYLFNTCTVTENAERECRQLVRRSLRINPGDCGFCWNGKGSVHACRIGRLVYPDLGIQVQGRYPEVYRFSPRIISMPDSDLGCYKPEFNIGLGKTIDNPCK